MRAKLLDEFIAVEHLADRRFQDITGNVYGRLTVVSYAGQAHRTAAQKWNCLCQCGNKVAIASGSLKNGSTQSCGCLHKEATIKTHTTHGEASKPAGGITSEYRIYCCAKGRCNNPTDHAFPNYGGRGIEFRFDSYKDFIGVVGRRPSTRHTLDRIDVNGHYEAGNLRWATWHQQGRNRRNNRMITINGLTKCQSEWAETYGISTKRIHSRRQQGWCDECAITLPPATRGGNVCRRKTST